MNQSLSCIYYIKEGRFNEAREANIRAQELNPDYLYTYLQFFTIDFNLGNDARAMEALQTFLSGSSVTSAYMDTIRAVYQNSGMNGLWNLLAEIWQKILQPPVRYRMVLLHSEGQGTGADMDGKSGRSPLVCHSADHELS